ncbi:hypothetical protein ACET3X_006282 [Alternaria dauci]|uniref:Uncharacterized protein n=1 Tax=Alternaria dauci TaxID=48095 RepID=A0ABR3UHU9_9PLEO
MQDRHHTGFELDQLLAQAPNLVHLAINFCPINLGHARHLGAKLKLFKQYDGDYVLNEVESLLIPIAKHQNLETLRIFTAPSIDYGMNPNPNSLQWVSLPEKHIYTSQAIMQAFATEVFRLLAGHGSNIRALAMAPEHVNIAERPVSDENGHQWPRYYYKYGVTRTMNGQEDIVAVPILPAEFPILVPT